jgi:hypothetical protein
MDIEHVFTMRVIVTSIAGGVVVLVGLALIKSIISGGKRVVWEILRITAGLICLLLAALSSRGSIGSWGAWLGFAGVSALLLANFCLPQLRRERGTPQPPYPLGRKKPALRSLTR